MSINSTLRGGVVVALLGAAALTAPAIATALPSTGSLGSSAPEASCSTLSTEATPNGWGIPFSDEKDQTASYSADNVLAKDGSLKLDVDRKSVVEGKSVSVRVDLGGSRIIKKKTDINCYREIEMTTN